MKNPYQNAIPFAYVLLETYKKIGLSEEEAFLSLMIDHLIEGGNRFIAEDSLALKMRMPVKDISLLMQGLLEKGFLSYKMKNGKMETSLSPLIDSCYDLFAKSLERQNASNSDEGENKVRASLYSFFEERLGRTLSPLEKDTISEWLLSYKEEEIRNALLDTLRNGKKTLRAVEKTLKDHRKEADLLKEGASAISDTWDKDIEATMELTRSLWGKRK